MRFKSLGATHLGPVNFEFGVIQLYIFVSQNTIGDSPISGVQVEDLYYILVG